MKHKHTKRILIPFLTLLMVFTVSCSSQEGALTKQSQSGSASTVFSNRFVAVQNEDILVYFDLYIHEDLAEDAEPLFQAIIDSIGFTE